VTGRRCGGARERSNRCLTAPEKRIAGDDPVVTVQARQVPEVSADTSRITCRHPREEGVRVTYRQPRTAWCAGGLIGDNWPHVVAAYAAASADAALRPEDLLLGKE
jgi:hypothetical protein